MKMRECCLRYSLRAVVPHLGAPTMKKFGRRPTGRAHYQRRPIDGSTEHHHLPGPAIGCVSLGPVSTASPPQSTPRPRRRRIGTPANLPAVVGTVAGAVLCIAIFLPWYVLNIAEPFQANGVSGWSASNLARIALVAGLVVLGASAAPLLAGPRLAPRAVVGLAWTVLGAAVVALALVSVRALVLPDPAALFSRQFGLYVAIAGAVAALVAGIGQLAGRD